MCNKRARLDGEMGGFLKEVAETDIKGIQKNELDEGGRKFQAKGLMGWETPMQKGMWCFQDPGRGLV